MPVTTNRGLGAGGELLECVECEGGNAWVGCVGEHSIEGGGSDNSAFAGSRSAAVSFLR